MEEVSGILAWISNLFSSEPSLFVTLSFFTAVIIFYSVFVYYFYIFLAKKNILELNLHKYSSYENEKVMKFFAGLFHIIEYLIFLPVLSFFWFAVLAILILLLAEGISISTVLLISAALVASVRVTSYVSQTLSRDLAKMLPITLLAIAITKPGFFEVNSLLMRISEIPSLINSVPLYLVFIVVLELIMRFLDMLNFLWKGREEIEVSGKVLEESSEEEE